jgi:hypothetical protein
MSVLHISEVMCSFVFISTQVQDQKTWSKVTENGFE